MQEHKNTLSSTDTLENINSTYNNKSPQSPYISNTANELKSGIDSQFEKYLVTNHSSENSNMSSTFIDSHLNNSAIQKSDIYIKFGSNTKEGSNDNVNTTSNLLAIKNDNKHIKMNRSFRINHQNKLKNTSRLSNNEVNGLGILFKKTVKDPKLYKLLTGSQKDKKIKEKLNKSKSSYKPSSSKVDIYIPLSCFPRENYSSIEHSYQSVDSSICKEHQNEKMFVYRKQFYCKDCLAHIKNTNCFFEENKVRSVHDIIHVLNHENKKYIDIFKKKQHELKQTENKSKKNKEQLIFMKELLINQINSDFDSLIKILQTKRREFLENLEQRFEKKHKIILEIQDKVESTIDLMGTILNNSEYANKNTEIAHKLNIFYKDFYKDYEQSKAKTEKMLENLNMDVRSKIRNYDQIATSLLNLRIEDHCLKNVDAPPIFYINQSHYLTLASARNTKENELESLTLEELLEEGITPHETFIKYQ